ncbi:MAG: hypothetical protein SO189_02555 [Erysipelotrichaceae bacterium]|nr:hypothetical protein [Solobacterium sp.]MDY3793812.1 hypothetical protein [Erysipelotrichaceae bacterium]
MKRIFSFFIYILMHINIAVCFIDTYIMDKLYASLVVIACLMMLITIRPKRKEFWKKLRNRTYYYLLFAFFLSFLSFVDKVSVPYEWFSVKGFKIWLNFISLILIIKTIYGYASNDRYLKRNPKNELKAKSLLIKNEKTNHN